MGEHSSLPNQFDHSLVRADDAEAQARSLGEEQDRLQAEEGSHRQAEMEARQQTIAEEVRWAEARVQQKAEDEKQRIAQLEAIRPTVEIDGNERAEIMQRLKKAETEADVVESEARRLAELESNRNELESHLQSQSDKAEGLKAEIACLRKAEAKKAKQIEKLLALRSDAEAKAQHQAEEEARLKEELEAHQLAAAEARNKAAEEANLKARQEVQAEASQLAAEQEERVAALQSLRTQLKSESLQRSKREQQLHEEIQQISRLATAENTRIEKAEATLAARQEERQRLEELARSRAAEEEALRTELETFSAKVRAEDKKRAKTVTRLQKEIEALRKEDARKLKEIEKLEAKRLQAEEKLREREERKAQRSRKAKSTVTKRKSAVSEVMMPNDVETDILLVPELQVVEPANSIQEKQPAAEDPTQQFEIEGLTSRGFSESELSHYHVENVDTEMVGEPISATADEGTYMTVPEEEIVLNSDEWNSARVKVESFEPELPQPGLQSDKNSIDLVESAKGIVQTEDESGVPPEVLEALKSEHVSDRVQALAELGQVGSEEAVRLINESFDDQSIEVRNAAAHALCETQSDRAASFTAALREGTPERRRRIGAAIANSGLATQAVDSLTSGTREKTYSAFSLLFLMAKAGTTQPLMEAIETHTDLEVRLAVVKLLALSGQTEIVPLFRRLAVRGALPSEVRSAVMEAIHQIGIDSRKRSVA